MKYIYKNAQENIRGSIDCLIYVDQEWVPHTQDPAVEYELHDSSDWDEVKPCNTKEKEKKIADKEALDMGCKSYLTSTDWYVIRQIDSGIPIPEDIKAARAKARASIK